MNQRQALIDLLNSRSVTRGDFTLSSGKRSTYYIDARRTTMSAEGMRLIGQLGLAAIRSAQWEPHAVGGLTLGADPVAYAIARESLASPPAVNAFTVRKSRKEHGRGNLVEGCFEPGAPVVIVEDVITSGGSAIQAARAVTAEGGRVLGILGVVDRQEGGTGALEREGFDVRVLVTAQELGLLP